MDWHRIEEAMHGLGWNRGEACMGWDRIEGTMHGLG